MDDMFASDSAACDELVLVDGLDRQIGTATKLRAHTDGLLHRAFSVVLVRTYAGEGQLLLARRAQGKYHSAGLWGNSCCSHPRANETVLDAARRRVPEELGCEARDLCEIGSFVYRAEFASGLAEYEYDHVLMGTCDKDVTPAPDEVDAVWWVGAEKLALLIAEQPQLFAVWARIVLPLALSRLSSNPLLYT